MEDLVKKDSAPAQRPILPFLDRGWCFWIGWSAGCIASFLIR